MKRIVLNLCICGALLVCFSSASFAQSNESYNLNSKTEKEKFKETGEKYKKQNEIKFEKNLGNGVSIKPKTDFGLNDKKDPYRGTGKKKDASGGVEIKIKF